MKSTTTRFAWDRADAWLGLGSMGLLVVMAMLSSAFGPSDIFRALNSLAFFIQPYLVARVVRHFRPVSNWLLGVMLAAAIVAVLYGVLAPKIPGVRLLLTTVV